jgi:TPR repeat protein
LEADINVPEGTRSQQVEALEARVQQGDLQAIRELGTMFRFGVGVEQNLVTAADLHVIAALDGDAEATRQLAEYREQIETAALAGDQVAALALVKMYDRALGVTEDKVRSLAWARWAAHHCTPADQYDSEAHSICEFYDSLASDEDSRCANLLVDSWMSPKGVGHYRVFPIIQKGGPLWKALSSDMVRSS